GPANPVLRDDARRPLPRRRPRHARPRRRRDPRRVRGAHGRRDRRGDRGARARLARDAGGARALARAVRVGAGRGGGGRGRGRGDGPRRAGARAAARADRRRAARAPLPPQARPGGLLRATDRLVSAARASGSGRYAVGIDFGTESGRAVLVDCADGRELGSAGHADANGVIDECLPAPDEDVRLEADWALQDPDDYVATLERAVPALLAETGVHPAEVIGVGIDFTSCTMLPTTADGTPLCRLPEWRRNPHAWVKLWKHHAAQPEADRINEVAAERGEPWLARYGGENSSQWVVSKALPNLLPAPPRDARADRPVEAAGWTGRAPPRPPTRDNRAPRYN